MLRIMDSLKTMFFFVLFFTFICFCIHGHVQATTNMWRSEDVCGRPCEFWGLKSGMQTWQKAFLFLGHLAVSNVVCVRVCVFNPVSHCSSHFVLSILELDWLATELWISSVSYHIITGSFYRGAGDHDTPVFLIVYQLNHLSSS